MYFPVLAYPIYGSLVFRWSSKNGQQIKGCKQQEKGTNTVDIEDAKAAWMETQGLLDKMEKLMEAF